MDAGRKLTLKDLSQELGLARSTVSRALREDPQIAAGTRARVRKLADARGYRPDAAARALTRRSAHAVGLMLPRSSELVFANPYFSALLLGVTSRAEDAGYAVVLSTVPDPDFTAWPREGRVDGLLVLGSSVSDGDVEGINRLVAARYPVVAIHAGPRALEAVSVGSDERGGVWQALAHLHRLGRRRVALLAGPRGSRYAERRVRAYRAGVARLGLEAHPRLVVATDDTQPGGAEACSRLLAGGTAFDAVLADNDMVALGALAVLNGAGRRVPRDVSVVGFDDTPAAAVANPALTSVRQPTRQLGELAFDALVTLMGGGKVGSVRLATELVVRDSTDPSRDAGGEA